MVTTNRRPLDFEELRFRKYAPKPLKRHRNHPVIGLDTETYKGTCKLLADSDGEFIYNPSLDEILGFLTRKKLRVTHCFYYNMDFDVSSFLKSLPRENLSVLYKAKKTVYNEYKIKWIPKKFTSITKQKHVTKIYDLYQFYETSLEKAAEKYLHQHKTDLPFSRDDLNERPDIWNAYRNLIIEYCIKDAVLCRDLGYMLQSTCINELHLTPQNYMSRAALSKQYFRNNASIPDIRKIDKNKLRAAFYAYKGGRFELLKKGHFDYVELYDIKSAYPAVIRDLIDVTKGEWRYTRELNKKAYYGFYLCDVNLPYKYICPVPYVTPSDVLIYPFGSFRTVLTKMELDTCLQPEEFKVLRGYEFYPSEIVYPFREAIDKLFAIKNRTSKDEYLYELVKRIMNSLYGAFYEKIKKEDGIFTGKLFNSIYASLVTASTRCKLYEFIQPYVRDVVALATDSVLFTGEQDITESSEIGGWEKVAYGEAVTIQSGLYMIEHKVKTRGFQRTGKLYTEHGEFNDIFEFIQAFPEQTVYKGYTLRPVHLIESLLHSRKYTPEDVNTWQPDDRTLDINRDIKRVWNSTFAKGGDLWTKTVDSNPLYIDDEAIQKRRRWLKEEKELLKEIETVQHSINQDRRRIKNLIRGSDAFEPDKTLTKAEQVDNAASEMKRWMER